MKKHFILLFLLTIGLNSCKKETQNSTTNNLLSPSDFNTAIKNEKEAVIIDVRTPEEFLKGHLENAQNINFGTPIGYQIFGGARYMFNDNFGAYAEVGYGLSVANAGITIAF
jgi:hypothetical protein